MTSEELLKELGTIAGSVMVFIEFLKPYISIYFAPIDGLNEDTKAAIYRLLNILLCTGIVASSNNTLNLFVNNPSIAPIFGMVLTGIATGLGSTFLNFVASWATMRFITVPKMQVLALKAEAIKVAESIPSAGAFVAELKAEKV